MNSKFKIDYNITIFNNTHLSIVILVVRAKTNPSKMKVCHLHASLQCCMQIICSLRCKPHCTILSYIFAFECTMRVSMHCVLLFTNYWEKKKTTTKDFHSCAVKKHNEKEKLRLHFWLVALKPRVSFNLWIVNTMNVENERVNRVRVRISARNRC